MIIAAIYPVLLWFLVFRFRRTWPGFLLALLGTLAVWPIAHLTQTLSGPITGLVFSRIVYGEMALIGLVAAWLVSMRLPPTHPVCPYCRYDLRGLPIGTPGSVCPECGQALNPKSSDPTEPFCLCCGCKLASLDPALTGQTCPACGADESDFGNWTRAKTVRARAESERTRRQGRSTR